MGNSLARQACLGSLGEGLLKNVEQGFEGGGGGGHGMGGASSFSGLGLRHTVFMVMVALYPLGISSLAIGGCHHWLS
jgi:hypothetical protein